MCLHMHAWARSMDTPTSQRRVKGGTWSFGTKMPRDANDMRRNITIQNGGVRKKELGGAKPSCVRDTVPQSTCTKGRGATWPGAQPLPTVSRSLCVYDRAFEPYSRCTRDL